MLQKISPFNVRKSLKGLLVEAKSRYVVYEYSFIYIVFASIDALYCNMATVTIKSVQSSTFRKYITLYT